MNFPLCCGDTADASVQNMLSVIFSHTVELKKVQEVHAAAEKLRREKWIDEKTKKIKVQVKFYVASSSFVAQSTAQMPMSYDTSYPM